MFGIESLSRLKLRSNFPMVHEYLKGEGWYEMQGYNRIGNDSFANMFTMLSGTSKNTATQTNYCKKKMKNCLNSLPMIWKDFDQANYMTAYAEEGSQGNTFPVFSTKPTDYYFRPFNLLGTQNLEKNANCLGRRTNHSYIFDFGRQYMQRYLKIRPIWGLFWANYGSLSSESLQQEILRDLLDLESDGVFDHTIMIFFGADHHKKGDFTRKMDKAFLDFHLPMMFIYLPPWFRKKYPKHTQALHLNQQRLSSNFDIYNTLMHIIQMGNGSSGSYQTSRDCPFCQSLFINLPWDRDCKKAGIPKEDCACQTKKEIHEYAVNTAPPRIINQINQYLSRNGFSQLEVRTKDAQNLHLGELLVESINNYLNEHELLKKCHILQLNSSKIIHQHKDYFTPFRTNSYRVKFSVNPQNVKFLTTVNYNSDLEKLEGVNVEHFSRLGDYTETSKCIISLKLKSFCICKSQQPKKLENTVKEPLKLEQVTTNTDEKKKLHKSFYDNAKKNGQFRIRKHGRIVVGHWVKRKVFKRNLKKPNNLKK
ncbi:uncharacterized protein LOC123257456 [Drosophila ananassae]|uniref:uncharacterized protein LOC123257456 n=1 Tax=Drosophila ananassae TaxID=7217 RepID=UPI001CFFCDDE|nr:uncharacterized protein LOC123257456 [Drosophila ananassae]